MSHDTGRFISGRWIPALAAMAAAIPAYAGVVYTSTNAPAGNAIVRYFRADNGALSPAGVFATNGKGTGAGLESQGAIALGRNEDWLLVVNAGSNDVTVFRSAGNNPVFRSVTPSGGTRPVSIAVSNDLVYVLNAGGTANIAGFHLNQAGQLVPIANSTLTLNGADPAQVSFNLDGTMLAVTYKTSNNIETFTLDNNDAAHSASVIPSNGGEPFGFAFSKGNHLLVSEAFGGAPNGSAVSSYAIGPNGAGQVISPSVGTTQTAACWLVVTRNGRLAFTGNTGSGTVSSFRVANDGSVELLAGAAAITGGSTVDVALGRGDRFLFALANGTGTIHSYRVAPDGTLQSAGTVSGLPAFAGGIAGL